MVPFVRVLLWTLVRFPTACMRNVMFILWEFRGLLLGPSPKSSSLPLAHITVSFTDVLVYAAHIPSFQFFSNSSPELKELIALHSSVGEYGGDLRSDTVTIIGATLDLQEKTAIHVRSCAYFRDYTTDIEGNF